MDRNKTRREGIRKEEKEERQYHNSFLSYLLQTKDQCYHVVFSSFTEGFPPLTIFLEHVGS